MYFISGTGGPTLHRRARTDASCLLASRHASFLLAKTSWPPFWNYDVERWEQSCQISSRSDLKRRALDLRRTRRTRFSLGVWGRGLMTRPVSDRYDQTSLRPASVLVLVLHFWSWSWSCTFGLGLSLAALMLVLVLVILLVLFPTLLCMTRRCVTWQCWNVTSTCVLSCNKYRNSAKRYWSSLFWCFFAPSYFSITVMHVATEAFFSVMHSCCCLIGISLGLGLGLNILILFPSLTRLD